MAIGADQRWLEDSSEARAGGILGRCGHLHRIGAALASIPLDGSPGPCDLYGNTVCQGEEYVKV